MFNMEKRYRNKIIIIIIIKLSSWAVPSYQVAHDMLHMIIAGCVAHDLHKIASGHLHIHVGDSGTAKRLLKSRIAPFSAIIIIIIKHNKHLIPWHTWLTKTKLQHFSSLRTWNGIRWMKGEIFLFWVKIP